MILNLKCVLLSLHVYSAFSFYVELRKDPSCPESGAAYYPHYSNCSLFFECLDGFLSLRECPDEYAWDADKQECLDEDEVSCYYTTLAPTSPGPTCPNDGVYYFPHLSNCQLYYECNEGEITLKRCDDGLSWNIDVNDCDYDELVDCSYTTSAPTTTQLPTSTIPVLEECPETGIALIPNLGDCNAFYQCENGKRYPDKCPDDYAWSLVETKCLPEDEVDCSYTTLRPSTPSSTCPSTGIDYLPDYTDCTRYYECNEGEKTLQECPEGEAWSLEENACLLDELVDCSYTISTVTSWSSITTEPFTVSSSPTVPETTETPIYTTEYTETPSETPTETTEEPIYTTEEPTETSTEISTEEPTFTTEEPTETSTEISTEEPTFTTEEPTETSTEISTEGPTFTTEEPTETSTEISTEEPTFTTEEPTETSTEISTEEPTFTTEEPTFTTEEPTETSTEISTEEPTFTTEEPTETSTEISTSEPTFSTEEPTETSTEISTEEPTFTTEEPTETSTEISTEGPTFTTEEPTETSTEISTEEPTFTTEEPTETSTEISTEEPTFTTEEPTETSTEISTEEPTFTTEEPTETSTEISTEEPTFTTEEPTETSTEISTEEPTFTTEEPTETSTEISTEAPTFTTEEPTETSTEISTEEPTFTTEEPTETSTEISTEEPISTTEEPTVTPTETTEEPSDNTEASTGTSVWSTSENPIDQCPDDGLAYFPYYADCLYYYQCDNGTKTKMKCKDGYAWNIVVSACDHVEVVDCGYITTVLPTTTDEVPVCPTTGTSYYPYPNDCSYFYECANGKLNVVKCPDGYLWDATNSGCKPENTVNCSCKNG